MMYKSSPVSLVALSITAALFTYLLWGVVDGALITTWLVVIESLFVVRLINYVQYKASGDKGARARCWGNRNLILVLVQWLIWGCGGYLLFPENSHEHQLIILIVALGVSAGAVTTQTDVQHAPEGKADRRPAPQTIERKNRTIMVVDDGPDITSFLSKLLDLNGYDTIVANNSYYGLELMGIEDVDLVISDQTMPGLNGVSLAAEIRKVKPECPVIICSGNLSDLEHIPAQYPHILAFMSKPIDTRLLLEKIAQTLH